LVRGHEAEFPMSEAKDRLARSRLAILDHVHRRQRRNDPREEAMGYAGDAEPPPGGLPPLGDGWFGHLGYVLRTWWRHHPAHMAVELATPALQMVGRRKPWHLLGVSAAVGAAVVLARPWKLISVTTLVVAIAKSSQLSNVLLSALSAADYQKDHRGPG
jgi:hypothetical protein